MSTQKFIEYLQALLTMAETPDQVRIARISLESLVFLTESSKKADGMTLEIMKQAASSFNYLVRRRLDFAGTAGAYAENEKKRCRLMMVLRPGC